VNIHKDSEQAPSLGALAYTQGNDVHFAPGQYDPGSQKGQELLGHELSHVVQQREGRVKPTTQGKGMPVNTDPALEKEADKQGKQAAQGKMADVIGRGNGVQKYDDSETNYSYREDESVTDESVKEFNDELVTEISDSARDYSTEDYLNQVRLLDDNLEAVYDKVESGFSQQAAAFLEAYNNYKNVLEAENQRRETIASILSIFIGFVAGFAGAMAEGMMKTVCGRFNQFVNIGVKYTDGIAMGVVDVMKSQIGSAAEPQKFSTNLPKMGQGFSDPSSFEANGRALINKEKSEASRYIQWLTNHKYDLKGHFSPAAVVKGNAEQLASLQAGGYEAEANADTKELEKMLWKSWIQKNGKRVITNYGYLTVSKHEEYNIPDKVLTHLKDDLGITEEKAKEWAGPLNN